MPRNIRWMLPHQWQPPSASIQAATQHLRLPEGGGCYRLSHHFALLPDQAAPASLPTPPHISFRSKPRQRLPASLGQTHLPPRTPATTHDSRLDPPVWQKNCIVDAGADGHGASGPAPPRPLRPQERAERTTAQRLRRTRPPPVPDRENRRVGDKETATAPHLITAGEAKHRCSPLAHDHRSSIVATRSRPPGLIREANNP